MTLADDQGAYPHSRGLLQCQGGLPRHDRVPGGWRVRWPRALTGRLGRCSTLAERVRGVSLSVKSESEEFLGALSQKSPASAVIETG